MAEKKRQKAKSSITTETDKVVCKEITIELSDEKLKSVCSHIYEIARQDAKKFNLCNYYGHLFSIGLTLLLPLLTSNFKDFNFISGIQLKNLFWGLCIFSFVGWLFLFCYCANSGNKSEHEERDKAINKAIKDITVKAVNADIGCQV